MTEREIFALKTIAFYTAYPWDRSLPVIRALGPLTAAGFEILKGNDWERHSIDVEVARRADLVLVQRDFAGEREAFVEITRLARAAGKKLVFDLDDLLLELPEDHPDRMIRYYDRTLVPVLQAMVEADAVTASTPALVEYIRPYNPNVFLLPNYLDDRLWKINPPTISAQPDRVTLGYIGGPSHLPDIEQIVPVLLRLFERYGERLRLKIWGMNPPDDLLGHPQVEAGEFIPDYAAFAARVPESGCDIFLGPLQDNLFNRCKSWIKFLEYAAAGVPAVFSAIEPYKAVVDHGRNGFLAVGPGDWEAALVALIEDPGLRYRVAQGAQETLRRDWLLSGHAHRWAEAYTQIARLPARTGNVLFYERLISQVQRLQQEANRAEVADVTKRWQAEVEEREAEIRSLLVRLDERERAAQYAQSRLAEFEASRTYRLLKVIWRVRMALAPPNSRRAGFARLIIQSAGVLRREGLRGLRKAFPTLVNDAFPGVAFKTAEERARPKIAWRSGEIASPPAPTSRYDVIVFPVIDWDFRFQRPQQIAAEFARRGHRVFYLRTTFHSKREALIRRLQERVWEVALPGRAGLNLYQNQMDEATREAALAVFDQLASEFSIQDAACLVDLPFWTPLVFTLRDRYGWKVVYDCMDYHRGFSTNAEQMLSLEEALSRGSDLVLASAKSLEQAQQRLNPNIIHVPNAADFDYFHRPPERLAPEVTNLSHPVIGYYGAISEWFDTPLVAELARQRPGWNFVLIGQTYGADLSPLGGLANVHLLGEKPYGELTRYLYAFDVCLLPFRKSPVTEATNPVKIYEYLSAGKPVVASDIQELHRFSGLIRLADGPQEWITGIEQSLAEKDPEQAQARIAYASRNTWQDRVDAIDRRVAALFPLASLVVLSYGNQELTRECLDSIFEKTTYPSYEVIVVDNASPAPVPDFLRAYASQRERCRLILNEANRGFAGGMNQGIAASRGEYVLLLNNDIVVTRGWLGRLIGHLQRDPQIGLVGPVTNATGNEARIEVDYTDMQEMENFARRYTRKHWGETYPTREFAMYCVAMRRSLIDEIGLLDEQYAIGMFEDDDYAYRIRQAGYKIVCARDVFVHHYSLSAFKAMPKEQYLGLFRQNQVKFEQKWQVEWKSPRILPQAELIRCADQLAEILENTPDRKGVIILPPSIGWDITLFQRPHHLARAFARLGYLVFFCETENEARGVLGFRPQEERLYLGWAPLEVFDFIDRPCLIVYAYNKDSVHFFRRPRIIFDHVDDLEVFPFSPKKLQQNFTYLVREAELVVATADRLLDAVRVTRPDAILVPNGVDLEHFQPAFERRGRPPEGLVGVLKDGKPVIGYYGALARWFDYELLETLIHRRPDLNFVLIGPDHDGTFGASGLAGAPNLFYLGPRPYAEIPQYLAWFDIATIPFVINDITRSTSPIKLFEYLAAGKPVVATAMPECRKYLGVFVAEGRGEFERLLDRALECAADQAFRRKAQAEASRHGWLARAQEIAGKLP